VVKTHLQNLRYRFVVIRCDLEKDTIC